MAFRNWMFTLNNPDGEIDFSDFPEITYAIYQHEMGENGTPHFQGYLELSKKCRLSAMKKILPGAHFEARRGTQKEAIDYCSKEDTRLEGPWTYGTLKEQGKRSDLLTVKRRLDEGISEKEIADEHFPTWARYYKSIREYKRLKTPHREAKTAVIVIVGPTGTGKSYTARETLPTAYWKDNSLWWDGYDSNPHVIIDEFYGWIKFDQLLRLLDENPMQVEYKGGHYNFVAEKLIITSNKPPHQWYGDKCYFPALKRRIDKIILKPDTETKIEFTDYSEFEEYINKNPFYV